MRVVRTLLPVIALAICLCKCHSEEAAIVWRTNAPPVPESVQSSVAFTNNVPTAQADERDYEIEADSAKIEFAANYRRLFGGDYQSLAGGRLYFLYALTDLDSFGLSLEAGGVQLANGSEADLVASHPYYLEAGIVARHYFTPSHVFLRPYITLNLDYFRIFWDYRNPIHVDGERVNSDFSDGVEASAGVGLSVHLLKNVSAFGEINGGGVAVINETDAGVNNRIFPSFGCIGVKTGLSVSF